MSTFVNFTSTKSGSLLVNMYNKITIGEDSDLQFIFRAISGTRDEKISQPYLDIITSCSNIERVSQYYVFVISWYNVYTRHNGKIHKKPSTFETIIVSLPNGKTSLVARYEKTHYFKKHPPTAYFAQDGQVCEFPYSNTSSFHNLARASVCDRNNVCNRCHACDIDGVWHFAEKKGAKKGDSLKTTESVSTTVRVKEANTESVTTREPATPTNKPYEATTITMPHKTATKPTRRPTALPKVITNQDPTTLPTKEATSTVKRFTRPPVTRRPKPIKTAVITPELLPVQDSNSMATYMKSDLLLITLTLTVCFWMSRFIFSSV